MAETKKDALAAFDTFVEIWGVKYDKAVECLIKDRDAPLVAVVRQQIIEPDAKRELRATLPILTAVEDATSIKGQATIRRESVSPLDRCKADRPARAARRSYAGEVRPR